MAEEEEAVETPEPDNNAEVIESAADDNAEVIEPARDYDGEARKQGWVPKEEYFGSPDSWRGAEEFVRRGEEVLPIVKAKYEKRIATLEESNQQQQGDFDQRIARMEKTNQAALAQQAQQIRTSFASRKRAAVENMDTEAFDAAEQGERQAMDGIRKQAAEAAKEPEAPEAPQISRADQATVSEWMAENNWFASDRILNAAADEAFIEINNEAPGMAMEDRLAEVKRRVSTDYPKKFGVRSPNRVEGGNRQPGGGTAKGKFASLPSEAKSAFADFKDRGVYTDKNKEEYAAAYFEE